MMRCKKIISTDMLQLALVVILLRLSPEIYSNNRWNNDLYVREIYLGTSSAYTQANFHSTHLRTSFYNYPKSINSLIGDELSVIIDELNYLGTFSWSSNIRNDVIAYLASSDGPQSVQQTATAESPSGVSTGNGHDSRDQTQGTNEHRQNTQSEDQANIASDQNENLLNSSSVELSPEDMDLIEILWKQDIDLGVSRDAFDSRENHSVEKLKEADFSNESKLQELDLEEGFKNLTEYEDKAAPSYDPWEKLNYTIDSETGEHIFHEPLPEEGATDINSEDCLFSDEVFQQLSENLFFPLDDEVAQFPDFSADVKNVTNFPSLSADIPSDDPESLDAQLEKLVKLIKEEDVSDSGAQEQMSEIYPSMEECWQDIATTLPLSVMGSSHQGSLTTLTRPAHLCPAISNNNTLSANHAGSSDTFSGVLLQNASLAPPVADINNTFSYMPTLGPSSIGCAVAASMGTLSNDTEPVADGSAINTSYNPEFSELIYTNHTTVNSQSEYLLSELLLDEDLQLMDMATSAEANYTTPANTKEDHMDTSSDSAVSLTSDRVPSISDCQEWIDSCSETSSHHGDRDSNYISVDMNLSLPLNPEMNGGFSHHHHPQQYSASPHHPVAQKKYKLFGKKPSVINDGSENGGNGFDNYNSGDHFHKEPQYLLLKNQNSSSCSVNFPYGSVEGAASSQENSFCTNESVTSPSGGSYANHMLHNHSYHLPFISSNCSQKPVMRDKARLAKLEEERSNRDEKRARALKIPICTEDIINLPIDEFNEKLSKYELTEPQLTLIRDIRRRGKNKVAAQNCRKRKMDQISTLQQALDELQAEKMQLETEQSQMLNQRRLVQDKYAQLYHFVLQASSPQPSGPPDFFPQLLQNGQNRDIVVPSNTSLETDKETDLNRGARTKRKMEKK